MKLTVNVGLILFTANIFVAETGKYLSSPEYANSAVFLPAVKSETEIVDLPLITSAEYVKLSIVRFTLPVASFFENVISNVAVSPTLIFCKGMLIVVLILFTLKFTVFELAM